MKRSKNNFKTQPSTRKFDKKLIKVQHNISWKYKKTFFKTGFDFPLTLTNMQYGWCFFQGGICFIFRCIWVIVISKLLVLSVVFLYVFLFVFVSTSFCRSYWLLLPFPYCGFWLISLLSFIGIFNLQEILTIHDTNLKV